MSDNLAKINLILDRYNRQESSLIMVLQDVQEEFRYLPTEALLEVARGLGLPQAKIFGVATFFKAFSLKPRGKKVVQVCTGTACHVRGSRLILEKFEREIGILAGETRPDLTYTLEAVNCVGACAMGPVVVVNDQMQGHITMQKVDKILEGPKK
jgi:NADH-quinone oxidoreductase subunit E